MKKALIIVLIATGVNVFANKKPVDHLAYESCRQTYESIKYLLDSGLITVEEAQDLWVEHKRNEQEEV